MRAQTLAAVTFWLLLQVWTSILGMNLNCLYAEPGDWTQVAAVLGEAANHYTNESGSVHLNQPQGEKGSWVEKCMKFEFCVVYWHLVSVQPFSVMYDTILADYQIRQ